MFPLQDEYLTVKEVAEYWSRELDGAITVVEICRQLIEANSDGLLPLYPHNHGSAASRNSRVDGCVTERESMEPGGSQLPRLSSDIMHMSLSAFSDRHRLYMSLKKIQREEFREFCEAQGWDLPAFWFKNDRRPTPTVAAKTACRRWLKQQIQQPKVSSKQDYWRQASKHFPALSRRAFDEVWSEVVPPNWKKPGAPRKGAMIHRGNPLN